MEKRSENRVPMKEKAQILFAGEVWACTVLDFCRGGMLLDFPVAKVPSMRGEGALLAGEIIKVALACKEKGKHKKILFRGEVRHRFQTSMGVRFITIDAQAIEILSRISGYSEKQAQNKNTQSASLFKKKPKSSIRYSDADKKLLHLFQLQVWEQFPSLVDQCLHNVEVALLNSSTHSVDSWLRTDFTQALQMITHRGHWLAEKTTEAVINSLKNVISDQESTSLNPRHTEDFPPIASQSDSAELAVVEKGEFEDWLAMSMASKKLENELKSELYELSQIISLLSKTEITPKMCPMAPNFILKGFRNACNSLNLPVSAQPVIYKTLGQTLKGGLRDFYASMISYSERSGVRVALPQSAKETSSKEYSPSYSTSSPTGSSRIHSPDASVGIEDSSPLAQVQKWISRLGLSLENPSLSPSEPLLGDEEESLLMKGKVTSSPKKTNSPGPVARDTFQALQSLLKLKSAVTGGGLPSSPGILPGQTQPDARIITRKEIQAALSDLQKSSLKRLEEYDRKGTGQKPELEEINSLKDMLLVLFKEEFKDTEQNISLVFSEEENERIEITDQLFNAIFKQVDSNEILKLWISKLRIIILHEVLRDKSFFINRQHPARLLINQLSRLGSAKLTTHKSLERSLEHFVTRILKEYQGDSHIFDEILADINKLVERQEKAFQRNAERIAHAFDGQQRLKKMRKIVLDQLNLLFAGKSIPSVVVDLLEKGGWQHTMVLTLLREGERSTNFKEQIHVLEQIVSWLNVQSSIEVELELDLEAAGVLEFIDRDLTASGHTGHQGLLDTLRACLIDGLEFKTEVVDKFEWLSNESERLHIKKTRIPTLKTTSGTSSGRWHNRAKKMKLGDWVEIKDPGSRSKRMRLAWSGSETYRFVYVDSRGLQEIDISLDEFAEKMAMGTAALLDSVDVPMVDQGLHQMVQSVYEDLASQASCDTLTGLMNRQSFERNLERAVADNISHKTSYVVSYIDVDQFKVINNTHGHVAGDHLLSHIAELIRKNVGTHTVCARIGGNEFGLIFRDCDVLEGVKASEKLCQAVENDRFNWNESVVTCTLSVGVATIDPDNDSFDSVMRKASIACMTAKEHGRNRVVEYESSDQDQARHDEMIRWIQRIDREMESMLFLRCQEIRPMNSLAHPYSHFEVLLGVLDEEGNMLPPSNFIEAAEHFGRMSRVDRWVVHNVLHWMEDNPDIVVQVDGFSINLSGVSMNDEGFLDFVLGELSATSVPREKICFEITETAAITNLSDANEFMRTLKKTGCKFSLDDFGTGLSSYAYIQKLPVDYIKIDGVFIRNIVNNQRDQALVKSITELAHFMGVETIAEFVENNEINSVLKLLGVDHSQGYGIGKPIVLDALIDHFAES